MPSVILRAARRAGAPLLLLAAAACVRAAPAPFDSSAEVLAMIHAKTVCSNNFVSGIPPHVSGIADLRGFGDAALEVDPARRQVRASIQGRSATAIFIERLGCVPVAGIGTEPDALRAAHAPLALRLARLRYAQRELPREPRARGVDHARLQQALASAFEEPGGQARRNTRAVVVVHKGRIVAERYAPGLGPDTPLAGFSLSKAVLNAAIGRMVREGLLADVRQPVELAEWSGPQDPRAALTWEQLMQMTAGLAWDEDYTKLLSNVMVSLFGSYDSAALAISQPVYLKPNLYYNYSSGNAQILSVAMSRLLRASGRDADLFPYEALFAPLGMRSALIERDPAGTPGYAASVFASAHDWARLGEFLRADGRVDGKALLPAGWMRYSTTPTEVSDGQQGVLLAVNRGATPSWPALPPDTFAALGFRGQRLAVVPSRELTIVRLGASVPEDAWIIEEFAARVIEALDGGRR